eukprot:TRINITY_DN5597_c0_g1_i1.p1 TRINITY_DN5597_c0_g1~~TRINITY_DN5597_c0_g1_i1.p1  ORF type:complete len:413 (-),score=20.16 TRINITY_DN5597_c0_g1_i1:5774-7012(-)
MSQQLSSFSVPAITYTFSQSKTKSKFDQYKEWVRKNSTLLFTTEHLLSQLTWLAPNRFSESELKIETLHSALGLVSWWHGILVADQLDKAHIWPLLLGALRQIEGVIELIAIHRCDKGLCRSKYPILTKLEVVKFSLKLLSMIGIKQRLASANSTDSPETDAKTQSRRVLIDDGLPKDANASNWQSRYYTQGYAAALAFEKFHKSYKTDPEEEGSLPSPKRHRNGKRLIGEDNLRKTYKPHTIISYETTQPLKTQRQLNLERIGDYLITISEIIHMSRPVAYLLMTRRCGIRSWQPWIFSLSVDGLSRLFRNISARCYSRSKVSESKHYSHLFLQQLRRQIWTVEELQEFNRRDIQLLLYLLRSPCFELLTRNVIEVSGRFGGSLPMLGVIVEKIVEILVGIQKYYTYTSGS